MNPQKILVIQLRRVGDVVFTLPVIHVLRKSYPAAQIDFLVEKPADQLVRLNPYLSETLVYDKEKALEWIWKIREKKYDWVLDFHSNGRTLILTLFSKAPLRAGFKGPVTRRFVYNRFASADVKKYIVEQKLDLLRALEVPVQDWDWGLKIPEPESHWASAFLKKAGRLENKNPLVGIAPATRRATRGWIPERFTEVLKHLTGLSCDVLFLWGPNEKNIIDEISLAPGKEKGLTLVPPETSLAQLSALIQKCSVVLAVDNGPKNIAVALGVPTVTLFGPTDPASFNPHGDPLHQGVRDEKLFCIACGLNVCPYRHECMRNIHSEMVLETLRKVLEPAAFSYS